MVKAVAINGLHVLRVPAEVDVNRKVIKKPTIEMVPAGAITELSEEDFEAFSAQGAVRRAKIADIGRSTAPVTAEDIEALRQPDVDEADLSEMTVPQLRALALDEGIDLGPATKKADIIEAIELAREGA